MMMKLVLILGSSVEDVPSSVEYDSGVILLRLHSSRGTRSDQRRQASLRRLLAHVHSTGCGSLVCGKYAV